MGGCARRRASRGKRAGRSDLNEIRQAQIDAARLLRDLRVADGDVRHDGERQGLERLMKGVREALGTWHLQRRVLFGRIKKKEERDSKKNKSSIQTIEAKIILEENS